jgi:mannose-6-phosphate isomerase
MWCVLEPGPIYAGLKRGVGAKEIEDAIGSGKFEDILVKHDAKRFDTFFIPGGLVHAIGDGVKLYEIQQSSNTTYRLYDWGRLGADGKPRELHIAKSLESIDFSLDIPQPRRNIDCEFFSFTQRDFLEKGEISAGAESLIVYEVEKTATALLLPGQKTAVGPGKVFVTVAKKKQA